ncbi:hypothetical protein BDR26DRAFT_899343 [Obelidium mucronatum]|nr:hypothetical protein BDR26DRAFT_899343 [Obelidium mucronatum]
MIQQMRHEARQNFVENQSGQAPTTTMRLTQATLASGFPHAPVAGVKRGAKDGAAGGVGAGEGVRRDKVRDSNSSNGSSSNATNGSNNWTLETWRKESTRPTSLRLNKGDTVEKGRPYWRPRACTRLQLPHQHPSACAQLSNWSPRWGNQTGSRVNRNNKRRKLATPATMAQLPAITNRKGPSTGPVTCKSTCKIKNETRQRTKDSGIKIKKRTKNKMETYVASIETKHANKLINLAKIKARNANEGLEILLGRDYGVETTVRTAKHKLVMNLSTKTSPWPKYQLPRICSTLSRQQQLIKSTRHLSLASTTPTTNNLVKLPRQCSNSGPKKATKSCKPLEDPQQTATK